MIHYTTVSEASELKQILALQKKNISTSISFTEKEKEGFVTVQHDIELLRKMNASQPHIIAKHNDVVIGYTLCMTKDFGNDIDILKPMFTKIENSAFRNKRYIVMGQVCIDKDYRAQGIFRKLYLKMKQELQDKYDFLITEVASDNTRSLNAHYTIGFKELTTYKNKGIQWHLISWDYEYS